MLRSDYLSIAVGSGVATALAVTWQLVDSRTIPLSLSAQAILSSATLVLCPTSFLLTNVDPASPLTLATVMLYLTAIFLNGLFYAAIVAVARKLFSVAKD